MFLNTLRYLVLIYTVIKVLAKYYTGAENQLYYCKKMVNSLGASPQNGRTHSISLFFPTKCLSVSDHFVGLTLKGLLLHVVTIFGHN